MSTSWRLHRLGRVVGDIEAAAKGPDRLAKRMLRRKLAGLWFRPFRRLLRRAGL